MVGGQLGQLGHLEGGEVGAVEVRPQVGLDQVGQVVRRDLGNWSDWSGERANYYHYNFSIISSQTWTPAGPVLPRPEPCGQPGTASTGTASTCLASATSAGPGAAQCTVSRYYIGNNGANKPDALLD